MHKMATFNLQETTEQDLLAYYRVSTRLDRAIQMIDHAKLNAPDIFIVKSQTNGERYVVDLRANTCTCADWTHRGSVNGIPCKHIMAAWLSAHRKGPEA
jgi:predicted nucleic acid-binding Zn finger protein